MGLTKFEKDVQVQLVGQLEKEWEDGMLADATDPEMARKWIKRYISRAANLASHWAAIHKNEELAAAGRERAFDAAVDIVQRHHDVSIARVGQIDSPPEPEPADGDAAGADVDALGRTRRQPGERPSGKRKRSNKPAPVPATDKKPAKKQRRPKE